MRWLVTGATGFIGRHLCRALAEQGEEIVALLRSPRKRPLLPHEARVLEGDLSLFAKRDVQLPRVDVVVHLAGVVSARDPEEYRRINSEAVAEVLAAFERQSWKPKRFLFASSLAAAGPSERGAPHTERDDPQPIDAYGGAKNEAEAMVADASFWTTTFRPCIVLGPEDPATLTLFKAAAHGFGFRVAGDPQELSFIDVRDLVSAIIAMGRDERPGHATYFVSHSRQTDTRELWDALSRALDRRVLTLAVPRPLLRGAMLGATALSRRFGFDNQLDEKQYQQMTAPAFCCSSAALQKDLAWQPKFDLVPALRHAAEGYRAAGML